MSDENATQRWRATLAQVGNNFSFHPATDVTGPQHDEVRMKCKELALYLADNLPPGRHQSLALTAVEEAMHWANSAIACDS